MRCCLAAALVGIAATAATFYPGTMPEDAIIQLTEARTGVFYDWHPPLMSWVWSLLDQVVPGPFGMLLLHNLLFWLGLVRLVYLCRLPGLPSAALILAIGWFPPIFTGLGTIWKDVGMASALLLAFALLLGTRQRASRTAFALSLACLLYALSVRHNAALAVYPLALWAGVIVNQRRQKDRTRRWIASLLFGHAIFVALGLMALTAAWILVDGRRLFPSQQILIHDLAAVSLDSRTIDVPEFLVDRDPPMTLDKLACVYNVRSAVAVFNGRYDQCAFRLRKITRPRQMVELVRVWLNVIPRHLRAYLHHRVSVFREMVAFGTPRVCYPLQVGIVPNSLGIEFHGSAVYEFVRNAATRLADTTPLFRAWIYLAATLALLFLAVWLRPSQTGPAIALGASGVVYTAGFLPAATTCDFRMSWWVVVATVLLPLLIWRRGAVSGR